MGESHVRKGIQQVLADVGDYKVFAIATRGQCHSNYSFYRLAVCLIAVGPRSAVGRAPES